MLLNQKMYQKLYKIDLKMIKVKNMISMNL